MTRYSIALAARSALYMPLYLAKVRNPKSGFKMVDFVYKEDTEFDAGTIDNSVRDPLLNYLLTEKNDDGHQCLLAVCDPFRALLKRHGHANPMIAGTLINHMFFWLIDHDTSIQDPSRINRLFERIVVSPRHMTGYAVACYYLLKKCSVQPNQINDCLYYATRPGFEADFCRRFQDQRRRNTKNYAYLTWDIKHKFARQHNEHEFCLHDYEEFKNCAMTALVVNHHAYEQSGLGSLVDEIIGLTYDAVKYMGDRPESAAADLREYGDSYIAFPEARQTEAYIKHLNEKVAFSDNRTVDMDALEKTIRIRKDVICLNPYKDDYDLQRSIADYVLANAYSARKVTEAAFEGRIIDLSWRLDRTEAEIADREEDEQRSMMRAVVVAFIVGSFSIIDLVIAKWWDPSEGVKAFREWLVLFGLVLAPAWVVAHDARRYFWAKRPLSWSTNNWITVLMILFLSGAFANMIWREFKVGSSVLAGVVVLLIIVPFWLRNIGPEEERKRERERREKNELDAVGREIEKRRAPHLPEPFWARLKRWVRLSEQGLMAESGGSHVG